MKNFFTLAALTALLYSGTAQTVTRGPYLQMVNQTSATIRWRTDVATTSKVNYGTTAGSLSLSMSDATSTLEHELRVNGLGTNTKYFYSIGSTTTVLDANGANWFITAPDNSFNKKIRIAAFGDCGLPAANRTNVRDKYLNYIGNTPTDVWLLLGDNAYFSGYDYEYQTGFFDGYKDNMLRNHPLFPAPGNHDYRNDQAFASDRTTVDYYKNFTLPKNAECGGVASNTEAYYSFDWGNVHFLSLDSYGKEDANTTRLYDTLGEQVTWIKLDLAATTKKWVIAYFHHPPFTRSSHNSDTEGELIAIRQNFIRILERYGVDLVLCGHSHAYERSYLLKGYYTNQPSFVKAMHTADSSSAKYDASPNSCPYHYDNGKYQHGTVYVVSGSAGQGDVIGAGMSALPFVYGGGSAGGSSFIEVDDKRLDLKMIGSDGGIKDQFTILKDVNKVTDMNISSGDNTSLTASWPGNYVWSTGAATKAITVAPTVSTSYTVNDNLNCLKDSFRVSVATILPLLLRSFSGTVANQHPVLTWITAQELNLGHFDVQRLTNGRFADIARVVSKGNSANGFTYTYEDAGAGEGAQQYRLQMVDLSGSVSWSAVVSVVAGNKKEPFTIYPEIIEPGSSVQIRTDLHRHFTVEVTDASGKLAWHASSSSSIIIPGNVFTGMGVYLVSVQSSGQRWVKKVLVR
ncbi:MAG: metallophosphoesterase family protein [Chitinophagaceae bacterium]